MKGVILWFSQRDGNGILIDERGNEVYFDTSVSKETFFSRKQAVTFDYNEKISNCLCAKNVKKQSTRQRYKSLIDNVLYDSRGAHSSNTYIEIQIRKGAGKSFEVTHTDGTKILAFKIVSLDKAKKLLRSFQCLK